MSQHAGSPTRSNMKRRLRVVILGAILATFVLFLGWQQFAPRDVSSLGAHRGTVERPLPSEKPQLKETPTLRPPVQDVQSSITSAGTSRTSAVLSTTSAVGRPAPSLHSGDEKLLQEAPRYVQAIVNIEDTSFRRLSCPVPTTNRYEYLRSTSSYADSPSHAKYFFALNLYQCVGLLPRLLGTIVETMHYLGPENCALSLVEGRSDDGTFEVLLTLKEEIERMGAQYYFNTSDINPKAGEGVDRIKALADLRNMALAPLTATPGLYGPDTTVMFINDVSLCMEDLLELIHQKNVQKADMTCAMDWIFGGSSFYDVWVSRGMSGDQFFEIPQSGSWDFAENLFWNDPDSRSFLDAKKPFQVFACWNGATAFSAEPILQKKITFRTHYDGECYMGEPTLFCKDLWHIGKGKIAVIPSVNVGYNDEESAKVKNRHGYVSQWTGGDESLVSWNDKPPELVKCVPNYQHPSWVASDEGLAAHDNMTASMDGLLSKGSS